MKRFKNILVILDQGAYDDVVLDHAVRLASLNEAGVAIRLMVERPAPSLREFQEEHGLEATQKRVEAELLERLVESISKFKDHVRIGSIRALEGDAFIEIIRLVLEGKRDLVMIPAADSSPVLDRFLGSTQMHLLRKCPCPVWVFQPQRGTEIRRIMAAVDVLAQSEEEDRLNLKIVELASSLAVREQAELYITYCWSSPPRSILSSLNTLSAEDFEKMVLEHEQVHRQKLVEFALASGVPDSDRTHLELVHGNPGTEIPSQATDLDIDLLVMGTVARTGITGLFIGNAAETIIHRVPCSVLAVKPDGFETPITP